MRQSLVIVLFALASCGTDAPASSTPAVTFTPMPPVLPPPPAPAPPPAPVPELPPAPSLAPADVAAKIDAWLAGPLRGHDNNVAHLRRVTLRRTSESPPEYTITIANQFGFQCQLHFDPSGTPSMLRDCVAGEHGWYAEPDAIPLVCETNDHDEVCRGSYRLGVRGPGHFLDAARFQIMRPLHPQPRPSHSGPNPNGLILLI